MGSRDNLAFGVWWQELVKMRDDVADESYPFAVTGEELEFIGGEDATLFFFDQFFGCERAHMVYFLIMEGFLCKFSFGGTG